MTTTPAADPTRPELLGTEGMVSSTHWLASAAGMSVLERGGNAFDAAVTTGFVLQVVEPHQNGPGGDMVSVFYDAKTDGVDSLCGQGPAPQLATIEHFNELGLDQIPGSGFLPACVPGAFDAWMLMLRDYGTWRLEDVLAPAIAYARNGYPIVQGAVDVIERVEDLFRDYWSTSAEIYLSDTGVPVAGSLFRNTQLADSYERLVTEAQSAGSDRERQIEKARSAWSQGFVAEAIDKYFSEESVYDVTGTSHRGLLRGSDLANWSASVEPALAQTFQNWTVYKSGAWTQGPSFLQQLALLEGFDLGSLDPLSAEFVHIVAECAKLAMADRDAWLGDPSFVLDRTKELLDPRYIKERRGLVGETASAELRPGTINGVTPRLPKFGAAVEDSEGFGIGEPIRGEGLHKKDTVHFNVADKWGNLVSAMPSGGWLHSSPAIPGLGFAMGTRGQMFTLDSEHPNALAPGKRPRTTLSPGIAVQDDGRSSRIAFGSPGGDSQEQWPLVFLLRHIFTDLDFQQIIDMPMFHTDSLISSFYPREFFAGRLAVESRFPQKTIDDLVARNHDVVQQSAIGRLGAAAYYPATGLLKAAANARGAQGYAVGR